MRTSASVPAIRAAAPSVLGRFNPMNLLRGMSGRTQPSAAYMRDNSGNYLGSWRPGIRDAQEDVRSAWQMGAARAIDSLHNNGWLAGAIEQASADTIGTGLRLNATPDAEALKWKPEQARKWCKRVERRWKAWSTNPLECDARGRRTIADMTDAAIRYHFAFGEAFALLPEITRPESRTKLKVMLVSPHTHVNDTNELARMYQGVTIDADGLPTAHSFRRKINGVEQIVAVKARSSTGRCQVVHVFDGQPDQVRGMTPLAPVLLRFKQYEQLADATLTASMLQTIIAATVKSSAGSDNVFEGFRGSGEGDGAASGEMKDYLDARVGWWKNRSIDLGTHGRIAHLFPGEEFDIKSPSTPHNNYLPFSRNLLREIARCIGTTYENMTGDYEGATYSSVRMATSAMWFITLRRRSKIAQRFVQQIYETWLAEEIQSGRIEFPGGVDKFNAFRMEAVQAEWNGPAKPAADDLKSAKAASARLESGTTSLAYETAEYGLDPETVAEQRAQETELYKSFGLADPHAPKLTGGANDPGNDPADDTEPDPDELIVKPKSKPKGKSRKGLH